MAGEMSRSELTEEAYPVHFYVARHLRGTVEPFDQYRGPYIKMRHGNLYLIWHDHDILYWFDQGSEMQSFEFEDPSCHNESGQGYILHKALDAAIFLIKNRQSMRKTNQFG